MKVSELLSRNGLDDEHEPWETDLEAIEFGADLVVLCEDGVALWSNDDRAWSEVEADQVAWVANCIYKFFPGGRAREARQFVEWMESIWEFDFGMHDLLDEKLADQVEREVNAKHPETIGMPREVLADYLQDLNHPEVEVILRSIGRWS